MEGSLHFKTDKTKVALARVERNLRTIEAMDWVDFFLIRQQADQATQTMKSTHDRYVVATQQEQGQPSNPELQKASDEAWAAEQLAYEKYAVAMTRKTEAMNKLDHYVHDAHANYYELSTDVAALFKKRQLLEKSRINKDGTINLDNHRSLAEIDQRISDLEEACDIAYERHTQILNDYTDALSSKPEEALAAK